VVRWWIQASSRLRVAKNDSTAAVVAVADDAEGLLELKLGEAGGEGQRRVDRAAVGVVHDPLIGSSSFEGHEDCVADKFGVDGVAHRPTDYSSRPEVENRGQVEPAFAGADLSDVGGPEHVRPDGVEVAAHQVRGGDNDAGSRGAPSSTGVCADQVLRAHQAGDAFAAASPAGAGQLGVHPRCAVGAMGVLIDRGDRRAQPRVGGRPRRGRPGEEGVEPRAGDREYSAEPLDAVGVSMIGDESEAADRIVSWAK
jgi:hypothetical protein